MANRILKSKISDGPNKAVFSFYLESDPTDTELVNYVLIDPAEDFNDPTIQMSILQIWYGFGLFDALLSFDDLTPYPGLVLNRTEDYRDLRYFGGIKDRSGLDHTGKLFISTRGFNTDPISFGTLTIEIRKD